MWKFEKVKKLFGFGKELSSEAGGKNAMMRVCNWEILYKWLPTSVN